MIDQQRDVFLPVPQGWHVDHYLAQFFQKILVELLFLYEPVGIGIGAGNDAAYK
jgi:hypothetical protein